MEEYKLNIISLNIVDRNRNCPELYNFIFGVQVHEEDIVRAQLEAEKSLIFDLVRLYDQWVLVCRGVDLPGLNAALNKHTNIQTKEDFRVLREEAKLRNI